MELQKINPVGVDLTGFGRRAFLKRACTLAIIVSLAPESILIAGCSMDKTETIGLINALIQACSNVIAVAVPGEPWIPEMQNAIAALKQAEAGWVGGGPVSVITSVLNTIVIVSSAIPQTAAYAPLIAIIVAGIEAVMAALPPSSQPAPTSVSAVPKVTPGPYVYTGMVKFQVHWYTRDKVGAFKKQFNKAAVQAGLPQAQLP